MNKQTKLNIRPAAVGLWPALALALTAGAVLAAAPVKHFERTAAAIPPELRTAIGARLRSIEPAGAGHYTALNPDNRMALNFNGDGLEVEPGGRHPAWHWALKLTGYGTSGHLQPIGKAEVSASGQRLEYRRGAVTEWYENRPEGLEQGFTLAQPPEAQASTVELRLETGGDLKAEIEAGGKSARFRDESGQEVLAYRDLSVIDAQGKTLPAHLALAGDQLAIEVDVRGAAWPVTVDPLIVNEEAEFGALDAAAYDFFGNSVAISGDTAAVGAPGASYPGKNYAGAVYVYLRTGKAWTPWAKLSASDAAQNTDLGYSVAISGDTIVAGAPYADRLLNADVGAAYVFVKPAGGWADGTETAKLTVSDWAPGNWLGFSVAISGDIVVAGAPFADVAGQSDAGAAYVYVKPFNGWSDATQTAKLTAYSPDLGDNFGWSVAVSGGTALVGAPYTNVAGQYDVGAGYVYVKPAGGWTDGTQTAQLTASDGAQNDLLGTSVGLSGDAAVAGAPSASLPGQPHAGAAYVYVKPGSGWANATQTGKLTASDAAAYDQFGFSVALSGDTVVAGAPSATISGNSYAGAAYAFIKPAGGWADGAESFKAAASNAAAEDRLGWSVAISGDTVVAGAPRVDMPGKDDAGAAYVYRLQYPLTVGVSAGGKVTSNPAGIACVGADSCYADFSKDTAVALTAAPDTGMAFSGWTGCDSSVGDTCQVTMNQAKAVTASFVPAAPTYNLSVLKSGKGKVTSAPTGIDCGPTCQGSFAQDSVVTLTATAAQKYLFLGWSGPCTVKVQGGTVPPQLLCEVTLNKSKQVKAKFVKVLP